jgi:3-oxoacyl-[acyl-carrier protein] reductase
MDLRLADRRVLVTGGTRGIGRAVVATLVEEGARVGFCARDADEVAATAEELGGDGRVVGAVVDVADAEALQAWVRGTAEAFGGLDGVVANVSALAIEDTEANWLRSVEVDLLHTVRLVRAALGYLERSDAASIVAISSVSGRESDFASGPYGTVKCALVGYMHGLALQLAPKGIRANTVSPGNTYFPGGVWAEIETNAPELYREALALNPTGRMGTPEEVAVAVAFLLSPRASRVSGTNLVVDGALTRGIQL